MSVEAITKEEMALATQPTRQEQIMLTPVEAVLAKESWDDVDVEILIMHQMSLPADVRAKLGIVPIKPLTPEQVNEQTFGMGPVATEEVAAIAATVPPATENVPAETVTTDAPTATDVAPVGEQATAPETVTAEGTSTEEVTTTETVGTPTVDNSQEQSN